jgi:MtN3 and saliva related transmembrane protein
MANAVGWISALILLATLTRQVALEWQDKTRKGISAWLFVGQLTASIGFIVYSVLVDNMVFIVTNALIATVSIIGQYVYLRNRAVSK